MQPAVLTHEKPAGLNATEGGRLPLAGSPTRASTVAAAPATAAARAAAAALAAGRLALGARARLAALLLDRTGVTTRTLLSHGHSPFDRASRVVTKRGRSGGFPRPR